MKRKSKWKGLVIALIVVAVVAGAGFGGWYFLQNRNTEPVKVFPFQYIGMTEYWGDSQESNGPVTTDRIQTVFLTETQTITEILVNQGDAVKKGDVLMIYDTTLSDLALEREHLEVEKLKLQLETAQDELRDIKKMKPMKTPKPTTQPTVKPETGAALEGEYQISQKKEFDGTTAEKSMILWLRDGVELCDPMFADLFKKAEEYRTANQPVVPPVEETEPTEPVEEPTEPAEEMTDPTEEPTESTEETTESNDETTLPTVPPTQSPEEEVADKVFVVIKVTEGNLSLTATKVWQGMELRRDGSSYLFKFFDAGSFQDHTVVRPQQTPIVTPPVDMGSGYTSAQIAQMKAEKEKQIKDLKFQIKMAEANFAIKKTEAENGQVLAQIDGTVVSLLTEAEAKESMQPIMKISGGGGFYVRGTVSELQKDDLQIGQEVTINDWNTGMTYTGSVQSVGDFPDANGYWNGMGNPNVSYYPFTVFIDGSADLQEGAYVNVVYSTATTQQGIYLENPFLRNEQGKSYVYVRGADGKLEQRFVTTGKALWGSYTEILSGITAEDFLAFPYGKNLTEGADTVESDLSELYG